MPRIKLVILSMLAVFVVGAAASATASAVPTRYFVEGTGELTASETVTGAVGAAKLEGEITTTKVSIECTKNKLSGAKVGTVGTSEGEVKFETCSPFSISGGVRTPLGNCKVTEPITFKYKDQLIAGKGSGVVEDEFKPETGTKFVEIELTGSLCTLKGKYEVLGTYLASIPGGEVANKKGELVFTATGSSITFAGKPASFTNTVSSIELTGTNAGKAWWVGA